MSPLSLKYVWSCILALGFGAMVGAGHAAAASARIKVWESPDREPVTHGMIELPVPPSEVAAAVSDFERWPQLFSDVAWAKVESGDSHDAVVRFKSRLLRQTVTVRVQNDSGRRISFSLVDGPPGIKSNGETIFEPIDNGNGSRIQASFLLDTEGFSMPGMDSAFRRLRTAKIERDMEDLSRAFTAEGSHLAIAP